MLYARLTLALIVGLCVTLAHAEPPVKLISPDADHGGWNFDNGQEFPGATGSLTLDPTVKHGDSPSLKLYGDFNKGGNYVQLGRSTPPVNPQLLSFWIRYPGAAQVTMRLIDGDGTCHQIPLAIKKTDDWQRIQFPVTAFFKNMGTPNAVPGVTRYENWGGKDKGWNAPLTGIYFLIGKGADKTNTLWLDDVQIIPEPEQPLTKAPTFTEDFEDDAAASRWTFIGTVNQTAADAYKGDHGLRMARTEDTINNPTSAVNKSFPAAPGKWEITGATRGELYSPDNSYQGRLNIQWLNSTGTVIEQTTVELTYNSPTWKPFRKSIEAPAQTASARFEASLQKTYGWYEIDELKAEQQSLANVAEKRIDQVHLKSDIIGNLFEPDQPVVLHMTVNAIKQLAGDELNITYVVRDYWGAEQNVPATVPLTGGKEVKSQFLYTADIDLSPMNLEIGKYFELHATVHPRGGEPVTEYRGLARLPKPVTWQYPSADVPFTIRNWDSRIPDYMRLAHRLGIRNIGTWGNALPQPNIPGLDLITQMGDSAYAGTPAGAVEGGSDKYSSQQIYDAMVVFTKKFTGTKLTMLCQGNEPHGGPEQIKKNVAAYKAVYEAVKSVNPDIFIVGTSVEPNEEYFRNEYYKYLDAYDFHTYEGYQGIKNAIQAYKKLMTKYNAVKPIFTTEMGSNSQGMTRYAVAVEMIKKFSVFFAEGGVNASWFTIMYPDNAGKARGTSGDAHCVFDCRYSEYNPKLDAISYFSMVNGICVKKFAGEKEYDGVRAFLFTDSDNRCLQILWNEAKRRDIQLPLPGVKSVRLVRVDGSEAELTVFNGGLTLGVNDEPLLLIYDQPTPALAASLKPGQFQLSSPITSIVKGGSTTFQLAGANLTAASLKAIAPPQWAVQFKQLAAGQVQATVTSPLQTDAREGRLLVQQIDAGNHVTGEIIVSVPVTDQLAAQLIPGAKTKTQDGAIQLQITNYQNTIADIDWEMDLTKQYPMAGGAYKMSEGEHPAAFFAAPNNGHVTLQPGKSTTVSVPLASVDAQTLYRVAATLRSATGRTQELDRLFGGFANVPKARHSINVDGKLDESDWADAPVQSIGEQRQSFTFNKTPEAPSTWTGPDDLSAKIRFLWDDQYFYVSVDVTDDIFAGNKADGSIWNQDGVQFLIDPKRESTDKPGKYDYSVGLGTKGPQVWCNFSASQSVPNGEAKSVIVSIKRKDAQTGNMIYEMAFPWASLAPFKPQVSANLGLCLIMNEDDGPGRAGFVGWFSGAHSKDLDVVGDLILGE